MKKFSNKHSTSIYMIGIECFSFKELNTICKRKRLFIHTIDENTCFVGIISEYFQNLYNETINYYRSVKQVSKDDIKLIQDRLYRIIPNQYILSKAKNIFIIANYSFMPNSKLITTDIYGINSKKDIL